MKCSCFFGGDRQLKILVKRWTAR